MEILDPINATYVGLAQMKGQSHEVNVSISVRVIFKLITQERKITGQIVLKCLFPWYALLAMLF